MEEKSDNLYKCSCGAEYVAAAPLDECFHKEEENNGSEIS